MSIELAPADWEVLRFQGRDVSAFADCRKGPPENVFRYFPASVTINGVTTANVGLRKKGFLGSLLTVTPALKIGFDKFDKGGRYEGMTSLTLNNNRQDPARIRQCLAYSIFAKAGVPSPRCRFAEVSVNGQRMGTYTNVEPIGKPFLRRHFGSADGILLKGELSDFDGDRVTFEHKSGDSQYRKDLEAIADVFTREDDREFLEGIANYIDLDDFLTFWAVENLVGQWDGYNGKRNNFFLYKAPSDQKYHFIPWGPDLAFSPGSALLTESTLSRRLYGIPSYRARYEQRVKELLTDVWHEPSLIAEIRSLAGDAGLDSNDDEVAKVTQFVETRRKVVEGGPGDETESTARQESERTCLLASGNARGTFKTTWGSLDDADSQSGGTLTVDIEGESITFEDVRASSGMTRSFPTHQRHPVIRIVGTRPSDPDAIYSLDLNIEHDVLPKQKTIPFHGFATWGKFLRKTKGEERWLGLIANGAVTVDAASLEEGAVLEGAFEGVVYREH